MSENVSPPVFDPNLFPSRHRPFHQWLLDHNPCLLLSTVLMLLGCYLVNSSIHGPDNLITPLILLVVINVYEACIIPLGLVLIRRTRGTARDGWWLLLFEALFLVNATFVNVDFRTGWGLPVNLLLFVLACIKAAVIMRGLRIGLSLRTFGFFALQLGMIYGLPILFAFVQTDGVVSARLMYALWWVVGLLPLAYDLLARWDDHQHTGTGPRWDLVQQVIRRVYLMVPWVLLVVHMRFAHWAHHAEFSLADLSPVLLGIAIVSRRPHPDGQLRLACKLLPVVAFVLAFFGNGGQAINLGGATEMISAPQLTFVAGVATYSYLFSLLAFACTLATLFVACVCYVLQDWIMAYVRMAWRVTMELLPTTPLAWGIAVIIAAFGLLGVGSVLGLRRTARDAV